MPVAAASEKSASVRRREPRAQQLTRAAVKLRHCRPALKSTWAALGALRQHSGSTWAALGERLGSARATCHHWQQLVALGALWASRGAARTRRPVPTRVRAAATVQVMDVPAAAAALDRPFGAAAIELLRCGRCARSPIVGHVSRPRGRRDEERLGQWAAPRALQCRDHAVETVAVARACAGEGIEEGDRARVLAPPVALGEREGIGVQFITIGYTGAQWPLRRDGSLGSPD